MLALDKAVEGKIAEAGLSRMTQGYSQRLLSRMGFQKLAVVQPVVRTVDFVRFGVTVFGFGFVAYQVHPVLLNAVSTVWNLETSQQIVQFMTKPFKYMAAKPEATPFENNFLGYISILYAVLLGNTLAFLYNRQTNICEKLYKEIHALEQVLQEAYIQLSAPALRWEFIQLINAYVSEELYDQEVGSPFDPSKALCKMLNKLPGYKEAGCSVQGLYTYLMELAAHQTDRNSASVQLLPFIHWVMLYTIGCLYLFGFLLLESTKDASEERHILFSVTAALIASILYVQIDMADPDGGLYTFRQNLDARLAFIRDQTMNVIYDSPIQINAQQAADDYEEPGAQQTVVMDREESDGSVDRQPNGTGTIRVE